MTQTQADNLATLIDLLENEVRDEEYDQNWMRPQQLSCCAEAHARRRRDLFTRDPLESFYYCFSGEVFRQVFSPWRFGRGKRLGRPARLEAIRRLRKILDDDGWEIAD